jgi:hypothetical protein
MRYAFAKLAAVLLTVGTLATEANAQGYPPTSQDPNVQLVDSWYRRYLGRPVDQVGLNSWLPYLNTTNCEAGILGSWEYLNRNGGTAEGFVTGLYVDVLGRQPAVNEVQGWVVRLQQFGGDRTALADEFLRAAATELSLRGQAPPVATYQPVVPPVVYQQQVPLLNYTIPATVPSSVWFGRGFRQNYWSAYHYGNVLHGVNRPHQVWHEHR